MRGAQVSQSYNVDPRRRYRGPEFDEYCISQNRYLPASRDRTPCVCCPLQELCQAGFEEQVRRVVSGENPSLTDDVTHQPEQLRRDVLLSGLNANQQAFVTEHIRFQ